MDEKTEKLRDIFLDVTEAESVTESQQEEPGSLTADETAVDSRLQGVIEQMRETFALSTTLTDEELCEVVRRFYAGEDDDEIAAALDRETVAVFDARMELLLIRDTDRPDEELGSTVREHLDTEGRSGVVAAACDVDEETARRAVAVVEAANRSRRVSHRFRTAFEEILTDADLSVQLTAETREDGLDGATEGAEVDVEF
jgi:hypothetical protein